MTYHNFGPDFESLKYLTAEIGYQNFEKSFTNGYQFMVRSPTRNPISELLKTYNKEYKFGTYEITDGGILTVKLHKYPQIVTPIWFSTFQATMYRRKGGRKSYGVNPRKDHRDKISCHECICIIVDILSYRELS